MLKLTLLSSLLLLCSCSQLQPKAEAPLPADAGLDLPEHWSTDTAQLAMPDASWWQHFGSVELNRLIEQANQQNLDLKMAAERVSQAELQSRIQDSSLWPSVSASAGTNTRRSDSPGREAETSNGSSLGLSVSYEVDLWGRLKANRDAAQANLAASRYDQIAARLSLNASISQSYLQLQALQYRLALAERNLDIAQRVMNIVQARYQNGTATALDVSRQQTSLLSQRASLLPLELQIRQTRSVLALLLGQAPDSLNPTDAEFERLKPAPLASLLPSELLLRRPDLARLEAGLQAANANILAARAALLPSLQLSGSAGLASSSLLSMANPIQSLGLAVNLAQTLFDHGKNQANIELSQSRRQELVYSYQQAILTALSEVEDALKSLATNRQQQLLQQQIVDEAAKTLSLAELRYQSGADELLSVLDAQRTLFQAQDQLAQLRLSQFSNQISLYKALGGGWQSAAAKP